MRTVTHFSPSTSRCRDVAGHGIDLHSLVSEVVEEESEVENLICNEKLLEGRMGCLSEWLNTLLSLEVIIEDIYRYGGVLEHTWRLLEHEFDSLDVT